MSSVDRGSTGGRTGREHLVAVGQALLVTFLWSTSWVLIKVGLDDLDLRPLGFAGVRYGLAALLLIPLGLHANRAARGRATGATGSVSLRLGAVIAVYGLLFITVAQGAQFAALAVLPATAVNLVLSSIPAVVAFAAIARREEAPAVGQLAGIALLVAGAALYFGPVDLGDAAVLGLTAALVCVAASAASAHIGRTLARDAMTALGGPIALTAASMAFGALVLLIAAIVIEGVPPLDLRGWAIVAWLAVVNTAFAFTLWNHTLGTLTAVESSVINNTMVVQIAVLAVVFLGETLTIGQVLGLLAAGAGAVVVQIAPRLNAWRSRRARQAVDELPEPMR